MPPGFDFRNGSTLGLETVFALAEHQLQGSAEFTLGVGLRCRIRFENRFYLARV